MANFDVLFAEDDRQNRIDFKEILERQSEKRSDQVRIYAATNPVQAKQYFENHRERGQNLCIISDGRMTADDFQDTDFKEPEYFPEDYDKDDISDLIHMAREWSNETGNEVFIVRRSADDVESTPLENLHLAVANNFEDPFILKKTQSGSSNYVKSIFEHCDRLFSLSV
jgi:CheY-like chemotaxis protein